MTLEAAQECLESHDVPCAPVRTAEQVLNGTSHFWDRGSLVPMNHGAMSEPVEGAVGAGFPVRFSGGELPAASRCSDTGDAQRGNPDRHPRA